MTSDVRMSLRLAGQVQRYHAWPTLMRQSTGEHSWQVLRIFIQIWPDRLDGETATYIEHHDSVELRTGDVTFNAKRDHPPLKSALGTVEKKEERRLGILQTLPSAEQITRVKVCDLLEMWEFGRQEQEMGNSLAADIVRDTHSSALDAASYLGDSDTARVRDFLHKSEWRFW